MADRDEFEEQVERLLPCPTDSDGIEWCRVDDGGFKHHDEGCPAVFRSAVAAALREARKREADLIKMIVDMTNTYAKLSDSLRAELDRLRAVAKGIDK